MEKKRRKGKRRREEEKRRGRDEEREENYAKQEMRRAERGEDLQSRRSRRTWCGPGKAGSQCRISTTSQGARAAKKCFVG